MQKLSFRNHFYCFSLGLIISGVLFAEDIPQEVKTLQKTAQEYVVLDKIPEAVACYQAIIQTDPNAAYAVNAQRQIVTVYEQDDQSANAKTSLVQMKQKYLSHSAYVKEAHEVGWEFVKKGDYSTALALYKDLLMQFPGHERAAWFQRSIVQTYLEEGDLANVKQSVEDLKNNFKTHPDYANQMKVTADRLRSRNQYETAAGIYEQLLKNDPNNTQAVVWERLKIQNTLDMGQKDRARAEVGTLFSSYKENPDFVKEAQSLGWEFLAKKDYATALRIYKGLREQFPDHERAAWFQRSIAQTYLAQGNVKEALRAVDTLKTDYSSHPDYINQMEKMAGILIDEDQPAAAEVLSKTLLEKFPNHARKPWFLHYKARSQIWMKDPNAVEAADATVAALQNYSSDPNYAETMSWTAYNYRTAGYYPQAIDLYQEVINLNPSDKIKVRCLAGIAQSYARQDNSEKMQATMAALISDYKTTQAEGVAFYVFGIGEDYYYMAQDAARAHDPNQETVYYEKALAVWQYFEQAMPSHNSPQYTYFSGLVSQRLKNYEQALGYYQQVLVKWPGYEKNWYIQYQIAELYEVLNKQGKASVQDIKSAYQTLKDKYFYTSAASLAQKKLENF